MGIEITGVGVAADARGVRIGVAVLSDATRAALTDRYDGARIIIEQSGPAIPLGSAAAPKATAAGLR
ncbi:MAG: hypothetical protein V7633_927 [Pseudonocardia sp.]